MNSTGSLRRGAKFLWGRVLNISSQDVAVDVGGKTLAKCPLWFFENLDVIPSSGMLVPCYVGRWCNAKGEVTINQERLMYLIYKWLMQLCMRSDVTMPATVDRFKWKGYVLNIFPHLCMNEFRNFKVFLPNRLAGRQNLNEGQSVMISLRQVDYKTRNVIAKIDQQYLDKMMEERFQEIKLYDIVDGTVVQVIPNGIIVNVKGINCFLSINNLMYRNENLNVNAMLAIGQVIKGIKVIGKNINDKHVYLDARHVFDDLNRYFHDGQRKVVNVRYVKKNKVFLNVDGTSFVEPISSVSAKHYSLATIKEGDELDLVYSSEERVFSLSEEARKKFWDQVALPKVGEVIEAELERKFKNCLSFYGDRKNYVVQCLLTNNMNRSIAWFDNFQVGRKYRLKVLECRASRGVLKVIPLSILIRQDILTMPRRILAQVESIRNNVLRLKLTPNIETTVRLSTISNILSLEVGAKVPVVVNKISLITQKVEVKVFEGNWKPV